MHASTDATRLPSTFAATCYYYYYYYYYNYSPGRRAAPSPAPARCIAQQPGSKQLRRHSVAALHSPLLIYLLLLGYGCPRAAPRLAKRTRA